MNILAISIGENYVKRSSSLEGQIIFRENITISNVNLWTKVLN
jgi:hypothetical protein